ncbi:MAG: mannose-phosphate guanylyltransferase [Solirubrobacterales bacterium]|nr:mannose-phosphate guanylyltransferase [Solirubrobacterales bacterium]
MQAIVLVGGKGTRLRPLTETVPKPALTLVDRPFLAYMIEWLAKHGVDEVVLACGFLPDVLREALAGEEERAGVRISYVVEPERRGTAGAIRFAADELGDRLGDRFLALNGDVLTDLDLTALLRAHANPGSAVPLPGNTGTVNSGTGSARATIALHPVSDSSAYGLVRSSASGEVRDFTEKTGEAVPGEVNAGMYVLERSVLDLIPPGEEVSIERDVFPRLVGEGLHGLRLDGYWMDIGTPERYLQASWDILEGRVETRVQPTAPGMLVARMAEVADGARIGPRVVLGAGSRLEVGAEVRESVLLDGCVVGEGARVTGSILSAGVEVQAGATLDGVVLGADERVETDA